MAGLLYKDFVAVKGKIWVTGILAGVLLMMLLKVSVPTETVNLIVLSLSLCMIVIMYLFIVGRLEISLVSVDETRKQRDYFLSLPVSKRQYVASKYIFLLIAFLIALTVSILLCALCRVRCPYPDIEEAMEQLMSVVPVFSCVFLFIPSMELPFFVGLGARRGNQIRTGLVIVLFFLAMIYLMFGDLSVFDGLDLIRILNSLERHKDMLLIMQVLMPYAALLLYYLSYRVSCLLFR